MVIGIARGLDCLTKSIRFTGSRQVTAGDPTSRRLRQAWIALNLHELWPVDYNDPRNQAPASGRTGTACTAVRTSAYMSTPSSSATSSVVASA